MLLKQRKLWMAVGTSVVVSPPINQRAAETIQDHEAYSLLRVSTRIDSSILNYSAAFSGSTNASGSASGARSRRKRFGVVTTPQDVASNSDNATQLRVSGRNMPCIPRWRNSYQAVQPVLHGSNLTKATRSFYRSRKAVPNRNREYRPPLMVRAKARANVHPVESSRSWSTLRKRSVRSRPGWSR